MYFKEIFTTAAIVLTFVAFYPYIRAIIQNRIKPHVFSWIIWGITTFIVFLAQLEDKGGIGAWPIGVSATITIGIAILAFIKRADITITRVDWTFFISALLSLPLWYFTAEPLWAVVVLTLVDLLGFGPTLRKAYEFPQSESRLFFGLFAIRNVLVLLALEHYSPTTILFPAVIALACLLLIAVIVHRRRVLISGSPSSGF